MGFTRTNAWVCVWMNLGLHEMDFAEIPLTKFPQESELSAVIFPVLERRTRPHVHYYPAFFCTCPQLQVLHKEECNLTSALLARLNGVKSCSGHMTPNLGFIANVLLARRRACVRSTVEEGVTVKQNILRFRDITSMSLFVKRCTHPVNFYCLTLPYIKHTHTHTH